MAHFLVVFDLCDWDPRCQLVYIQHICSSERSELDVGAEHPPKLHVRYCDHRITAIDSFAL